MTDTPDPMMPWLLEELGRMEAEAGLRARLAVPTVLTEPSDDWQTLRWSFRIRWQQVERSIRYVFSLPRERMGDALEPRASEVERAAMEAVAGDSRVPHSASLAEMLMELQQAALGAEVTVLQLSDGRRVGFPHDAWALSLPVSETERRVVYREALATYAITESAQIGPLRLLRPDVCRVLPAGAE
ncbi:MAG: hypothetical protein OXH38_13065 [Chloroflexi bacterium]|nr:hypothetical protein [Chloroflexota bacterium]